MKEVKAYIRVTVVQDVITALVREGFCCMSVIDVSGLGGLSDMDHSHYSLEYVAKTSKMAKIELVCTEESADLAAAIIRQSGLTHQSGDGIIFVSPVDRAIKIRTGVEGASILQDMRGI